MGDNSGMTTPIVETSGPLTLIGGGPVGAGDLALALDRAPKLVAADGGAAAALAAGHLPQAVIGDFDSLSEDVRARIPPERLFPVREQDTTDFDKALRSVAAPLVLGLGFLGGRTDHQLAVLSSLVRHPHRACMLLGRREVILHAPPALRLELAHGDPVSLFPLLPVTGRSEGLHWPLDGQAFAPDGMIGTSNRATGSVRLCLDGPGMILILPRGALDAVMQGLLAPGRATWPAPAG